MLNFNYDNKYDVLNIGIGDSRNSIVCEEYSGLAVVRDRTSKSITGLTIFDFLRKYKEKSLPIFPSDVKIDIEHEVMPFII